VKIIPKTPLNDADIYEETIKLISKQNKIFVDLFDVFFGKVRELPPEIMDIVENQMGSVLEKLEKESEFVDKMSKVNIIDDGKEEITVQGLKYRVNLHLERRAKK